MATLYESLTARALVILGLPELKEMDIICTVELPTDPEMARGYSAILKLKIGGNVLKVPFDKVAIQILTVEDESLLDSLFEVLPALILAAKRGSVALSVFKRVEVSKRAPRIVASDWIKIAEVSLNGISL